MKLISVKVLGADGFGAFTDIIAGMEYVLGLGISPLVANMSLGAQCPVCTEDSSDPVLAAFHDAFLKLVEAGIPVVVAAANEQMDSETDVPTSYDEAVAVSAFADFDGEPGGLTPVLLLGGGRPRAQADDAFAALFSNFGEDIDVTAPGLFIDTLDLGGGTATVSGTSFAAPHATGVAAIFLENHTSALPGTVRRALIESGECADEPFGLTFHGSVGCSLIWPDDPDGIAEPLVRADNIAAPSALDDVAVTSVFVTMPPAFANGIVDVTVGVVNHGDQARAFDVVLDNDTTTTTIGTFVVVNFAPGEWQKFTFPWNTSGLVDDHTLIASIDLGIDPDAAEQQGNDSKSTTVTLAVEAHDVAVTGVSATGRIKTDSLVEVLVDVENLGNAIETFDVVLTQNPSGVPVVVDDIELSNILPGAATTLTFEWDTTGLSGDQVLEASVDPVVPGDADTNNDSASTTVTVKGGGGGAPPPTGETGTVKGTVRNSNGTKLGGILVTTNPTSDSDTTNKGGKYNIGEVPTVTVSMIADCPSGDQTEPVTVIAGATVTVDFNACD